MALYRNAKGDADEVVVELEVEVDELELEAEVVEIVVVEVADFVVPTLERSITMNAATPRTMTAIRSKATTREPLTDTSPCCDPSYQATVHPPKIVLATRFRQVAFRVGLEMHCGIEVRSSGVGLVGNARTSWLVEVQVPENRSEANGVADKVRLFSVGIPIVSFPLTAKETLGRQLGKR